MGTMSGKGKYAIDTSPKVHDEVKHTTCYMCACRCGIKVHLQDGRIRYIEGNRDHPVNKGVLCAKGAAGIMNHYSPARLTKPLIRVGERGKGEFREVEWEEALAVIARWLGEVRQSDPRKLAFFTGRDQSQALTGWWAQQFGTPNYAAHGGLCAVNMAAAGFYTIGGSFWEFGEPDWERTRYFMMLGVAEDHHSNPIKIGLGKLKGRPPERDAKFVSVNPVKTGYSAIADEWLGIRPGTDGLFVLALIHELLRADKIDLPFLVRYSNAPWLIVQDPGGATDGLVARDDQGRPLCWDTATNKTASALSPEVKPAMVGQFKLPDGRRVAPVFHLMAARYLDPQYAPEEAEKQTGIPAETIRRIASEMAHAAFDQEIVIETPWVDWAGRRHDRFVGRPVSILAMRGIAAHSNGFHTCRAIHLLQILLGSIDTPGGFRYCAPYPKPVPPRQRPTGRTHEIVPGHAMPGPPLGFPSGPEQLLVEPDGRARRIDKAFSWEAPLAIHGLMHMVIANAWRGDPYPIDTLFLYMANMSWNSSMNTSGTMQMLTDWDGATGNYKIPHIIYSDAYYSEMVAYADVVLPDTTYLERHDCISLLDRPISDADGAADGIRQPVLKPDRDVRPFQDVLLDLGARLGLPGMVDEFGGPKYPGGYPDYIVNHERRPGIGLLAGWRGILGEHQGKGPVNPRQIEKYKQNQCFWRHELADNQKFYKHANRAYLEWATQMGFIDRPEQVVLNIYCEPLQRFRLAAEGHGPLQPPVALRQRVATYCDPLPIWYRPTVDEEIAPTSFPLHAITQRPMAMYHSWGSQNAWLRQIHNANRLFINRRTAQWLNIGDDDWVWVISHHGRIKAQARLMDGVNRNTVWTWNAVGKRAGAWNLAPDAPEVKRGFLLNHLIPELIADRNGGLLPNADPITGQAAWYDLRVRIEKALPEEAGETVPQFDPPNAPPNQAPAPSILRYGAHFRGRPGEDIPPAGPVTEPRS